MKTKYHALAILTVMMLLGLVLVGKHLPITTSLPANAAPEDTITPTATLIRQDDPTPTRTLSPTSTPKPHPNPRLSRPLPLSEDRRGEGGQGEEERSTPLPSPTPTPDMSVLDARLASNTELRAAICQPHQKLTENPREDEVIVPILLYHFVGRGNLEDGEHQSTTRYNVTRADFDAQLALLRRLGYETVTISEIVAAINDEGDLPPRPIAITVDDGWVEQYTQIFALLQKYQMRATFYIPSTYPVGGRFITWEQLQEMSDAGMEIGSHTRKHTNLVAVDAETAWYEINVSKTELEATLGISVTSLAYPYSSYSSATIELLQKAGYDAAVAMGSTPRQSADRLYTLQRFEIFGVRSLADFLDWLPWRGQQTPLCQEDDLPFE